MAGAANCRHACATCRSSSSCVSAVCLSLHAPLCLRNELLRPLSPPPLSEAKIPPPLLLHPLKAKYLTPPKKNKISPLPQKYN